jgi:alginate O-acetyltransferase complex protein AlgI
MGTSEHPRRRKQLLAVSVGANLCYLGFFKYFNFFEANTAALLHSFGMKADWATLNVILPVGISFYTFQSMSYTIDVYRKKIEPEKNFLVFAAFIALFPQLVAGPIVRAKWLLPQMHRTRQFVWSNFFVGMEMIVFGLFLKIVVADNLSPYVAETFGMPTAYNSSALSLSVIFFAFQIYGDFAGYSLIAIGLARIMGYKFPTNFRRPYFAASFSEFWHRWHISLSSWLRDYLYISLGGNRQGASKTYRNMMATMLLGGLWHGANWTFVGWGALHGSYLITQRMFYFDWVPQWVTRTLGIGVVFTLTCVAWIFFRAQTFGDAVVVLHRIGLAEFGLGDIPLKFQAAKGVLVIMFLVGIEVLAEQPKIRMAYSRSRWARTFGVLILLWMMPLLGSFSGQQFIYFQF